MTHSPCANFAVPMWSAPCDERLAEVPAWRQTRGQVATSIHAGLPWLLWLREIFGGKPRPHFSPLDGFEVPEDKSIVTEVYPLLFRRRRFLLQTTAHLPAVCRCRLEGWILGVC